MFCSSLPLPSTPFSFPLPSFLPLFLLFSFSLSLFALESGSLLVEESDWSFEVSLACVFVNLSVPPVDLSVDDYGPFESVFDVVESLEFDLSFDELFPASLAFESPS